MSAYTEDINSAPRHMHPSNWPIDLQGITLTITNPSPITRPQDALNQPPTTSIAFLSCVVLSTHHHSLPVPVLVIVSLPTRSLVPVVIFVEACLLVLRTELVLGWTGRPCTCPRSTYTSSMMPRSAVEGPIRGSPRGTKNSALPITTLWGMERVVALLILRLPSLTLLANADVSYPPCKPPLLSLFWGRG